MAEQTKEPEAKVEEAVEAQSSQPASPELTVQDLGQLKQVIDVASQRGAFKPNEMVAVGTIYNKLEIFLNAVATQQGENNGS